MKHVDFDYGPQIGIIRVPLEANKAKVGYYTFFSPEAKETLREHLEYRRRKGEKLTPESPLIKPPRKEKATYQSYKTQL